MSEELRPWKPLAVLLIGPLPPPIGGGSGIFQYIVDDLRADNRCQVTVINTSRNISGGTFVSNIKRGGDVIVKMLKLIRFVDVAMFNANERGFLLFGPFIYMACRFFGKVCVFRFFGGAFDRFFEERCKLVRWVIKRTVLSADACLFQTRSLVNYFASLGVKNVVWFSNYTRGVGSIPTKLNSKICSRFIFLGHIRRSKGIDVILKASPFISKEVTIDLYGPLFDGYSQEGIATHGHGRVQYGGVLTKERVFSRLWDYDALLLPTCHATEGYPGAIIEAFSHGLPVITTRWRSIPEIVDETCGILIEPSDFNGLARAVNLLHENAEIFSRLRQGSFERAQRFSDSDWTELFVELLQKLVAIVHP